MEQDGIVEDLSSVAPVEAPAAEQKMLSQDKVNELVKRVKFETAEKARREYESQLAAYQQQQSQASQQPAESQAPGNDMQRLIDERLARMAQDYQEKARMKSQEEELQRIANTYAEKMSMGKDLYDDFDEAMVDIDPADFYDVMGLAAELNNTPEVMYELAKNLPKLEYIDRLAKRPSNGRKLAMKELQRLSESIAANNEAKEEHVSTNPPLSKPKPSQVGTEKPMTSVSDFKTASWLRG